MILPLITYQMLSISCFKCVAEILIVWEESNYAKNLWKKSNTQFKEKIRINKLLR